MDRSKVRDAIMKQHNSARGGTEHIGIPYTLTLQGVQTHQPCMERPIGLRLYRYYEAVQTYTALDLNNLCAE